jgi:hypothetical protein
MVLSFERKIHHESSRESMHISKDFSLSLGHCLVNFGSVLQDDWDLRVIRSIVQCQS